MNIGGESNDECSICGAEWAEGCQGWVLCDTNQCPNTVCPSCTSTLSLSVSNLFYCPSCAGSGDSAAAAVGGSIATAVSAISELEKLPLSFKATRRVLSNLVSKPDEMKYRKLRLENKAVKELVDLEPVLNILISVGFTREFCDRVASESTTTANTKEEVLILEGAVPLDQINELLEIFDGVSNDNDQDQNVKNTTHKAHNATNECGKRKRERVADDSDDDAIASKSNDPSESIDK